MRLINADRLREDIQRSCMSSKDVETLVNAQPTAYDPDKVAEDLKKYAYSLDWCKRQIGCPHYGNKKIGCDTCAVLGAIDIVKRGGLL